MKQEKPREHPILTPEREAVVQLLAQSDQKRRDSYTDILMKYWKALEDLKRGAEREIKQYGKRSERNKLDDQEIGRELISELIGAGISPIISVERKFGAEKRAGGMAAREGWLSGVKLNVGTLGIQPFLPPGEDRVLFKVRVTDPSELEPRMAGDLKTFQGVVVFRGDYISPDRLTEIQQ